MTPSFTIITPKPYHCGAILRRMRRAHAVAITATRLDAHRELRSIYEQSAFRRALLIGGDLAALGGITGSLASATGFAWVVLSEQALAYPVHLVREAMRQIDLAMMTRHELATTVLGGDTAALRLAIGLGFHVADHGLGARAHSRLSRQALARYIESSPEHRLPVGNGYCIAMGYHEERQFEEVA